ncbi:MAG: S1C family serine protease [bacterium]
MAVEKVSPAVVSIETITTKYAVGFSSGFQRLVAQGGTSGFIVSPDGYAVTTYSQMRLAQEVQVVLHDGRRLPGHVANIDCFNDLAVVKIDEAGPFPTVEFADSDAAYAGETVLALGFPLAQTLAASLGVISSHRDYYMNNDYFVPNIIQTDTKFFTFNIGGPLIDLKGAVVGLNSFSIELAPFGGFTPDLQRDVQNLNIAFPSNLLREYVYKMIANAPKSPSKPLDCRDNPSKIFHPWFGLQVSPTNPIERIYIGMPEEYIGRRAGIIVDFIDPQGPAGKRGIRSSPADIIIGGYIKKRLPDGTQSKREVLFTSPRDLAIAIRELNSAEDCIDLRVIRTGGKIAEVEVCPMDRLVDSTVGSI